MRGAAYVTIFGHIIIYNNKTNFRDNTTDLCHHYLDNDHKSVTDLY